MTIDHAATDLKPHEPPRPRDATATRQLLLDSARKRFARDGFNATTVRDISTDAGVNVALINRYFLSKEGLFEACLMTAVDEMARRNAEALTLDQMILNMARQVTEISTDEFPVTLLLLLRSSGDERADTIRRNVLYVFSERFAAAAGWDPESAHSHAIVLHAQVALATILGVVLLRSSTGLEPLTSAGDSELSEALVIALTALFVKA